MFLACCFNGSLCAQSDAQIYERTCDAKTYPFQTHLQLRHLIILIILISALMVFYASAGEAVENGCFGK